MRKLFANILGNKEVKVENKITIKLPEALKALKEANSTRLTDNTDENIRFTEQYDELINKARIEWKTLSDLYLNNIGNVQLKAIYDEATDTLKIAYDRYKKLNRHYRRIASMKESHKEISESITSINNMLDDMLEMLQNDDIEF